MNLIKVLNTIRKQYEDVLKEREKKIEEINKFYNEKYIELKTAYQVNLRLNTACLKCEGTGKIDGSDGYEYGGRLRKETCPNCNGTGIETK